MSTAIRWIIFWALMLAASFAVVGLKIWLYGDGGWWMHLWGIPLGWYGPDLYDKFVLRRP